MIRRNVNGSKTRSESYYGAGDSPGHVDRYGQFIRVKNQDCMGYCSSPENAGAPSYKQWPGFYYVGL